MSDEKKAVDWDLASSLYSAGTNTLRDIAQKVGVSHAAVIKRANRDGWVRGSKPEKDVVVLASVDEFEASGFLYVIYVDSGVERFYKIGISKGFSSRMGSHQCSSPFEVCVAVCYFVPNMRNEEQQLHAMYADKHVRGEWFRLDLDDLMAIAGRALLV